MKKIHYLSYLRAVACIAIIILHTVDVAVILYQDHITNGERIASLSVVYCMMWAVPCFVMVTGALLLSKDRTITIKDVFGKYILRVLIALFAASLVFALFNMLMNREGFGVAFLARGFLNALTGNGWAHMWYLYLLIGLYLLMIFYRAVAHHVSDKEYRLLLLIYVVFLSILPLLNMWNAKTGFYIHVSSIYPFYLFAGYAVAEEILKINKGISILLIVIGVAGIIASTILDAKNARIAYGNLLGYSSIFVLLLAVGVFSFMKNFFGGQVLQATEVVAADDPEPEASEEKKPGIIGKIFLEIDRCSFGIYLIHMIFVRLVLRYWQVDPYASNVTILVFIGLVLGILIVSYGITALLKLIPGVKKIL
ncbi:MAG: acyltransferase [Lachnospiraceae bacterium]|nr:acyltransferase [Lachnospiraceae bacterium]